MIHDEQTDSHTDVHDKTCSSPDLLGRYIILTFFSWPSNIIIQFLLGQRKPS